MFKQSLIIPLIGTTAILAASGRAQVLFQDGFSNGANWTVLQPTDTRVTFGYNYANDAIPQAPNGSDRIGLKMEANLTLGVGRELAVVPTSFTPSGNYRVSVDIWGNYSTTGTGTTEFMGGFVGHDGVTSGVNGGGLIYTADGGALQDIRMYRAVAGTPAQELWIGTRGGTRTPSRQYNRDVTTDPVSGALICDPEVPVPAGSSTYPDCRDSNFGPFFQSKFPALLGVDLVLDPPGGQGLTQVDPQDAGVLGFQWNTLQIDVFPTSPGPVGATTDLGYATVKLLGYGEPQNPPLPPTEVLIGTIDNSAGVGPLVNFLRRPALVYADLFSSVASEPQFNFGIFDNFRVERLPGGVTGDFNNDGLWNCADVNALSTAIASGSGNLSFDMNGDGALTAADITDPGDGWLSVAGGVNLPSGNAYINGDANLDGSVDGSDFGIWNSNKFSNVPAWCSGNFNADSAIDGSDFGIWNSNKFQSSDASSSLIPEPGIGWLLASLMCWLPWWRSRMDGSMNRP